MWFQRSRALWATHGDKNSKDFHSRATQRFRKNKIEGIRNDLGQWWSNSKRIASMMIDFYNNLFSFSDSCQLELALESV